MLSTLGRGAASTIYHVKDRSGASYALKRVLKESASDQRFIEQAFTEHQVASRVDHPLLRKSFRVIRQRALIRVSEVLVLLEYVEGQTLEQSRPGNLFDLCAIFQKVAVGLQVLHDAGYVHADIKPNNILVTGWRQAKLIDFGQSCPVGTTKPRIQGTPDYIAPEQVLRQPITPATDAFNLGATMYWLLTGRRVPTIMPPRSSEIGRRRACHVTTENGQLASPASLNPEVPPSLSALVMECVRRDPLQRPGNMTGIAERFEIVGAQILRARSGGATPAPAEPGRLNGS